MRAAAKISSRRFRRAFTLVEMLLVLALIALLASVLILNLIPTIDRTEDKMARLFVNTTGRTALVQYRLHEGRFPSTEEGLAALVRLPTETETAGEGPYFDPPVVPVDPWKHAYQYRYPGTRNGGTYDLYSLGRDGIESADDIGNWP
jgi:general secretion pathway protein G